MKLRTIMFAMMVAGLAIQSAGAAKPTPEQVKAITKKVADWQIETFEDSGKYRALSKWDRQKMEKAGTSLSNYHDLTWHMGALYAGMNQWRTVADQPAKYADWLKMIGQRHGWKLHQRKYHADDHAVGQFYLSLHEDFNDPAMLAPTQARFDDIQAHPKTGTLNWTAKPTDAHHRWGWCDALFMAPPVWARLAKVTGEQKYLEFMDQEYHATHDLLWDEEENLFWRDSSFFPKREKNGEKLFWARGNGWVFGGLALMIPDMPKDWEGRAFYIDLFKKMAARIKALQRDDGTWSMGLLGGVQGYPIKETSGTSFFAFGLAWGINNGILDRATYEPAVLKAWQTLTECVTEEGLLGYVQPVGAAPGDSFADKTEVYGVGAFLAAGTEVYKLVGGAVNTEKPRMSDVRSAAPPSTQVESEVRPSPASVKVQKFIDANDSNTVAGKKELSPFWSTSKDTGNLWKKRTGFGFDANENSEVFEKDAAGNVGDALSLQTTVSGLEPGKTYGVYVCFLSMPGQSWRVHAGLSADNTIVFQPNSPAGRITDLGKTSVARSNRNQYLGFIGNAEAALDGAIVVHIDDGEGDGNSQRTWYEGIAISAPRDFPEAANRSAVPEKITTFMEDGGWCWYQDPRVILHQDRLYIGSLQGNGPGSALVGVYDLKKNEYLGNAVMKHNFRKDDHNSPVLFARPDGSVLAVYALHNNNKVHYYRISDPNNPLKWSEEMTFTHDYPTAGKVTYMNLCELKNEGKLYNFFRGIKFNPSFITSTDHGKSWDEPTHFIASELEGTHRPYARYAGNGVDTVHVSFTDGHPRNFGNSIYYAAFRDGKFYQASGELIKDLSADGPLRPSEAELIYKGSGAPGRRADQSALGAAWTSSMVHDANGHPHIGYSLYISNTDHRYRIASWDGSRWHDREVAFAGKCLYDQESSYTGLITLDPVDPTCVFISTDVDPATGKDNGGKHEIYRAKIGLKDDVNTIAWTAVTTSSTVRNIRPVIVRDGDRRVVLWNRGRFTTYTDYDLDTVGFVENATEGEVSSMTASTDARTYCRFVPERKDDFAWENDLIAFRAYGPALRKGAENSGIDCWLKRVNYPIINKWYAEAEKGKSYHQDHGEGLDNYHVGSSAGTGGSGLWLGGKREPLETYTKYEVIESTPNRASFKLSYEREIGGVMYGEEKAISIELGSRLFDVSAVFTKDGKTAPGLPVCIGLTTHDGNAKTYSNDEKGWIACWEILDGSGLGTAAMMDPSRIEEIRVVEATGKNDKDTGHILIITQTDANGAVRYRAGYGWEKARAIESEADWEQYLDSAATAKR